MENQKSISELPAAITKDTVRPICLLLWLSVYENDFCFRTTETICLQCTLQGTVVYKNKILTVDSPNSKDKREVLMEMLSSDPSLLCRWTK